MTQVIARGMAWVESRFKQLTKPAKRNQVMSIVSDLKRIRGELITENLFLRQQLIVLERQVVWPKLTPHDRRVLGVLASRLVG